MSQVTKLLLTIVMDRMKGKREAELDGAQSGFRQGKTTREGLFNVRLICESHSEVFFSTFSVNCSYLAAGQFLHLVVGQFFTFCGVFIFATTAPRYFPIEWVMFFLGGWTILMERPDKS